MNIKILRAIARCRQVMTQLWKTSSGDWQWLNEKPVPLASLSRRLWRGSVPSTSFFTMLTLSGIISTLGLLANSVALIIGAMIIAPLMEPILGMAYAMAVGNRRLLRRASLTLLAGLITTVVSSAIVCYVVGIRILTPEITDRAQPTILDLMVALAAGAAGAFAQSRRSVGDALPGVAIAVALVPPISVIGIGVAVGAQEVATGASLLLATNLIAVVFSGSVVFVWQEYGSLRRAKEGLTLSIVILILLGIPLGFSFENLLVQSNTRQQVQILMRQHITTLTHPDVAVQSLTVEPTGNQMRIQLELTAPPDAIDSQTIDRMSQFLANELQEDIFLTVRVMPMREFNANTQPGTERQK